MLSTYITNPTAKTLVLTYGALLVDAHQRFTLVRQPSVWYANLPHIVADKGSLVQNLRHRLAVAAAPRWQALGCRHFATTVFM